MRNIWYTTMYMTVVIGAILLCRHSQATWYVLSTGMVMCIVTSAATLVGWSRD